MRFEPRSVAAGDCLACQLLRASPAPRTDSEWEK